MTKPMVRIHDSETDQVIDREMTDDEFAIYEADRLKTAQQAQAAANQVALKASAIAKLVAGTPLTQDEAKTLVL